MTLNYLASITESSFEKTQSPVLAIKLRLGKIITLVQGNKIVIKDEKIAQTSNEYFEEIVPSFRITTFHEMMI